MARRILIADDAPHLLVVDDDTRIRDLLQRYLTEQGFRVTVAADASEARRKLEGLHFDLLVLDVMMPGESGLSLTRSLAADKKIPVILLTARSEAESRIAGLEAGADDYLAKPFQTEELIARLRALIRRAAGNASSELIAGKVRLDTRSGRVTLDGEPVKLTAQEYKLLSYLLHHKGKVVSRTELIEHLYDQDFDRDSNTIEVFIGRLRKKIGSDRIETVLGLGYRLTPLAGEAEAA